MNYIVFNLCYNLSNQNCIFLDKNLNVYVPTVGSIINIKGNPFIVYKIEYTYAEEPQLSFACVTVFKAGNFKLKIGKKYF